MQNFENSEKSRGAVVFAINTNTVDYVAIADQTSRLIKHNLKLPVTLITDESAEPQFEYDKVIKITAQGDNWRTGGVQWRNFGRHLAYELTPYHETVLLDTDYLVLDDSLLDLFETDFDYRLMHHNRNAAGATYERMGETSLPHVWATVILFRKTVKSQMLFDLVGKIQRNYRYYRSLYNIREGNFRNDYAFAVANNIINGYCLNESQGIPWTMLTIEQDIERVELHNMQVRVYHDDHAVVLPRQNLHVIDKAYLQTDNFQELVDGLTV